MSVAVRMVVGKQEFMFDKMMAYEQKGGLC